MKILIVSHYFPPHHGGIENVAHSQATFLASQGHSVTVVTSNLPATEKIKSAEFSLIRLPVWNILEEKLGVPYPIFSLKINKVLKREVKKADVVHIHGHVYLPSVLAARQAKRLHAPLVITQHNTFIDYKSPVLRAMQNIADKTLGKYTLNRSAKVITVSSATKDYMKSIVSVEALVQYNGVDVGRFKPTQDQAGLRDKLKLPQDVIICFTIRRITFKNGIDTLIETAKLLRKRKDIVIVIGGKGPDLQAAQKQVTKEKLKNVIFLGLVSDEDLPNYYAASNIFVLPSKKGEGFPLVVLEALASGLPVIATRSGGHAEIIEDSRRGFIVEPNQPAAIAGHIEELSKDPALLRNHGQACRLFAEENLSWEKNVAELTVIFNQVNV